LPKPPWGATPTIVPLKFGFAGAAGAAAGAAGAAGPPGAGPAVAGLGGDAAGEPGAPGFAAPGWFVMSMVPLNLGAAAAAFSVKPHLAHAVAVSWF